VEHEPLVEHLPGGVLGRPRVDERWRLVAGAGREGPDPDVGPAVGAERDGEDVVALGDDSDLQVERIGDVEPAVVADPGQLHRVPAPGVVPGDVLQQLELGGHGDDGEAVRHVRPARGRLVQRVIERLGHGVEAEAPRDRERPRGPGRRCRCRRRCHDRWAGEAGHQRADDVLTGPGRRGQHVCRAGQGVGGRRRG
jgi:hypothetical protein